MQMRLGFAVAAFLEPDILLVDEVLAVGDATFQQRCLDRMRPMLAQGTTLVFVSHDLAAVEATCTAGVWLDEGVVAHDGPVREALAAYRTHVESEVQVIAAEGPIQLRKATLTGPGGRVATTDSPLDVTLVFEADAATTCRVSLGLTEGGATPIFVVSDEVRLASGSTTVRCRLPTSPCRGVATSAGWPSRSPTARCSCGSRWRRWMSGGRTSTRCPGRWSGWPRSTSPPPGTSSRASGGVVPQTQASPSRRTSTMLPARR